MVCHGVSWCVSLFLVLCRKKTWCGQGAAMVCHGVPWCVSFFLFFCRKRHGAAMVYHGVPWCVSFFCFFCRKRHGAAMVRPWCVMVCHGVSVFHAFLAEKPMVWPWCVMVCPWWFLLAWCGHGAAMVCHGVPWCVSFFCFLHKKTWCGHGLATVCRRCVKGSGSSRRMQDKAAAAAERSWGAAQKAPKLSMPPATPSPASLRHPFGCCLRIHVQRALAAAMMVMRPRVMAAHHVTTTAYTAAVAALFRSARRLRQWIDLDRLLRRLLLRQGRHATSALTGRFAARASLPGDRHRSGSRESRASLPGPCYQLDAKQGKS